MDRRWPLATAVFSALAAGCAIQGTPRPPETTPAAFEHAAPHPGATWPAQDWYRGFGSAELTALVEQALPNNWDLEAARQRVLQADARARQAGAAILPTVTGDANASLLAGHSGNGSGHELDWQAIFQASYEVDFWGRNHAIARAALLQADGARVERAALALTILGGVAEQYFQVLALRERSDVAGASTAATQKVLAVVQVRFDAGVASPTELAAQKAAVNSALIAASDLAQQETQARAALALLLGRLPENFDVSGKSLDSLTEPPVAPGLPSELLGRRPDVALAEANLEAASANVVAARAAMFPTLALTIGGGLQNPALPATVLTIPGVGPSLALGANLVQPIFDHGSLKAQRDEALAREQELLAQYRGAILAALTDVEKALAELQYLDARQAFEQDNVTQSERAFEGARLRYEAGSGDFLTLLESQRTLYAARDGFTQYRLARLQARVALGKALGGGWQAAPTTAGNR